MCDCGRNRPPAELCTICHKENEGCTAYCRDAFIYDPSRPAEEIAEELKDNYIVGGKGGGRRTDVKIPDQILELLAAPEGPYAESARMIRRLRTVGELRAMMEDITAEKPITYAGYTIEWNPTRPSPFKVSSHRDGVQHTYVEIDPKGDISISLALPSKEEVHELLLAKGREAVYHRDPSDPDSRFPEQTLLAWLEEAIEAMNI